MSRGSAGGGGSGPNQDRGGETDQSSDDSQDIADARTLIPRLRSDTIETRKPVEPEAAGPEFVEVISDDLVVDNADSLRMLRPMPNPTDASSDGIMLEDIGAVIQTRATTQKIRIQGIFQDEEDTVVDLDAKLPSRRTNLVEHDLERTLDEEIDPDEDEDSATERLDKADVAEMERRHRELREQQDRDRVTDDDDDEDE